MIQDEGDTFWCLFHAGTSWHKVWIIRHGNGQYPVCGHFWERRSHMDTNQCECPCLPPAMYEVTQWLLLFGGPTHYWTYDILENWVVISTAIPVIYQQWFLKLCHPHTCINLIGLASDDAKAFITHRVPTQRSDSIHKNQFDAFAGCRGFDGITCNFNGGITCPLLTAFCVWVVERICRTWPKRYLTTSQTKVKRVTLAGYTTRQSSSS